MTRLAALAFLARRPALAEGMPGDLDARVANSHAHPAAQAFTTAARDAARLTGGLRAPPVRFRE